MISSKKTTLIGVILVAAVFIFTLYLVLLPDEIISGNVTGVKTYSEKHSVTFLDDDYYTDYSQGTITKINLSGMTAESASRNVSVEENQVSILGGGTYVISGELTDGNIVVNAADGAEVRLVLNGASVTSSDFSPLYVKQAGKVVISLVDGTQNRFSDGAFYNEEKLKNAKSTAAIYSADDLTVNGGGSLIVSGNYRDGIKANDTFKMTEGTLKVTAVDDGINANDYIAFSDTVVEVNSGGDAIKCENESADKGFIVFEGTNLTVVSDGDGIYSSSAVYANDVTGSITTGGGSAGVQLTGGGMGRPDGFGFESTASQNSVSTKAIKAAADILINRGAFTLDSADDAIHSDGNLNINDGNFTISTGDDAIHAEKNAVLAPEMINIIKCREGIEGAYITINRGDISIVSGDDGINAVGENSAGFGRMPMGGMHGGEPKVSDEDIYLTINGGNICIETSGDGIDSNGSAVINGGNIQVYGPENDGNGTIDVGDGGYVLIMNGGSLLAAGSSGMAESPYESSAQNSIEIFLEEAYPAGSTIALIDENKNQIISGTSNKKFNWICVSAEDIKTGEKYTVTVNGTEVSTVEVTGIVTSSGNQGRRRW